MAKIKKKETMRLFLSLTFIRFKYIYNFFMKKKSFILLLDFQKGSPCYCKEFHNQTTNTRHIL